MSMERVETPLHKHPLIPFTRFAFGRCTVCDPLKDDYPGNPWFGVYAPINFYVYGGFRCNELGCEWAVFHKECAKPLQEINHSSHPDHPLKLIMLDSEQPISSCNLCGQEFKVGYCCSICDFKLDLGCARRPEQHVLPENSHGHEHPHPLQLAIEPTAHLKRCNACHVNVNVSVPHYRCQLCKFHIHVDCLDLFPEAYHTCHPRHPLKSLKTQVPDYADKKCLLCATKFDKRHHQLHHCDVCNFSICRACMRNPPPVDVDCPTTHEHRLHLVPRHINFLCNACGTLGDRSPYFCLECNFMIHRECIGLPRVININRHDHRISYTRRLGHGNLECRVCRESVNGFYGAYTCSKCPTLAVHSRCATRKDVWDMVELEGTPEEEEIPPFERIDDNTIRHFSHDHNLRFSKDGPMLHENTLCVACSLQICSEPFYSCNQWGFILHEKCANLPQKKRHVLSNQPFTLLTDSHPKIPKCWLCRQYFTGFRYKSGPRVIIDVRCGSVSDSIAHKSHPHPLYYSTHRLNRCSSNSCRRCGKWECHVFNCEECDYVLDGTCALLPKMVMQHRYDDHPLFLSYGDKNVDGEYWCEACETRVNPDKGFYACNDCGVVLHLSCAVGDFSYIMSGSVTRSNEQVVSNISINRPVCSVCNFRCKPPSVLKASEAGGVDVHFCSLECRTPLMNVYKLDLSL